MNRNSHYDRREGEEVRKDVGKRRGRKSEGEGKKDLGERSEGERTG
jgi:hypothetical protein